MQRRVQTLLFVLALLLIARNTEAQLFGQWSWDTLLGFEQRSFSTTVGGRKMAEYGERGFRLNLGMRGFIVHPAIAEFRINLDTLFSNYSGTSVPNSQRWGIHSRLNLFPQGPYPSHYSYSYSRFDYLSGGEDPLATTGMAESISSWGARMRLRSGVLRGLSLGLESNETTFVEAGLRKEIFSRQFLDWSGAGEKLNHHYRLERQLRRYGRALYTTDDTTLTIDEHGLLSEHWRWDLSGVGFHRSYQYEDSSNQVDTGRLLSRWVLTTPGENILDLSYTGGFSRSSDGSETSSHGVQARYLWYSGDQLQLIPTLGFMTQSSDRSSLTSPTAGISASWGCTGEHFDLSINAGAGAAWIDVDGEAGSEKTDVFGWSAGISGGSGNEDRLRADLEISLMHNRLRSIANGMPELPDLGIDLERIGVQDALRTRLSLARRIRRWRLSTYAEYRRREQEDFQIQPVKMDSTRFDLSLNGPRLGSTFDAGTTDTDSGVLQKLHFFSGSIHWTPIRILSLRAGYLKNQSDVQDGPDVDRTRVELSADLLFGRFATHLQWWVQEEVLSGNRRDNRGLSFSVSARFAGWLPFLSAPQRRGIIR